MHTIENNPFRILGIISNASAKETNESETFILRYLDIGKSANLKFDITPPLRPLSRTSEIVKNAKRSIHDDFDKLTHSIFWFVNGTMVDKIALEKLSSEKNIEKATDSFRKGSRNFEISKSSYSSILNFSTLEIVSYSSHKDQERVKNAIKYKYQIIKDKLVFKELEKLITSNTDKINHKSFINQFIESTKVLLKELFPKKDQNKLLIDIFSEDKNILKEIEGQIVSSLVEKINENIASFDSFFKLQSKKSDAQIITSKATILNRAKKLMADTKSDLNKLKKIVGKDNFQYTNLANQIYSFVNAAVIICYNKEFEKNNVERSSYIELLEDASREMSNLDLSIKKTIIKNLSVIKGEDSTDCWFCNGECQTSNDNPLKIQMHKMTSYNSYTYFKDGGFPLQRCSGCRIKHSLQSFIAFILTLAIYIGLFFIVIGYFIFFSDIQNKFSGFKRIYHFIKNLFSFVTGATKGSNRKSVANHPKIKEYLYQGYKIGMP